MPKRTVKPRLPWTFAFAREWIDLANGQAGFEDLVEKGRHLHRKNRRKDPRMVAAQDFERALAPKRELIPGFNAP
ncbi:MULTISPECIES: hypothetical protein [unclassified Variovorax]|uniref:hypothetical protein n=1 Tax=unclassified Variovorax TaxID=663243 RepID=UPI003F487B57